MNARREHAAPVARIVGRRTGNQVPGQKPARLHRHADALGDCGMCFAGRVTDEEHAAAGSRANARPYGPGRTPPIFEHGTIEYVAQRLGRGGDVLQHACARRFPGLATTFERVAAHAAREADAAMVGVHHAAITPGKGEQRHESRRQPAIEKVRLEAEEIGCARSATCGLRGQLSRFPRPMRGDHDTRAQFCRVSGFHRDHRAGIGPHLNHAPGLPDVHAFSRSALEQQRVEVFAAQRAAPAIPFPAQARHVGRDRAVARE